MSQLYDERLQQDLNHIRSSVAEVSERVEHALKQAIRSLLSLDQQLANETILGDLPINRTIRAIDRKCHYFVARHLPSAGHLRFVSSVMRMTIAIERIGDYAVTIAREAKTLGQPLSADMKTMVQRMAGEAFEMLHQAIQAFDERSVDLARTTMGLAYKLDRILDEAFDLLVTKGGSDAQTMVDRFGTLIVLNRLERVSDQAKNICEETIFAITGETKKRKQYHVLFLEENDDCLAQMAVAYARKTYPALGTFESAGRKPASEVNSGCALFLEQRGIFINQQKPKRLEDLPADWEANHIIVSLQGPIDKYLDKVPFHTVALQWDLPRAPQMPAEWEDVSAAFEEIYRALTARVNVLVETLYGLENE